MYEQSNRRPLSCGTDKAHPLQIPAAKYIQEKNIFICYFIILATSPRQAATHGAGNGKNSPISGMPSVVNSVAVVTVVYIVF